MKTIALVFGVRGIPMNLKKPSANHSSPVWRRYLRAFMPLLFVEEKQTARR